MNDDELDAVVRELGRKIDALRDDFEALAMRGRLNADERAQLEKLLPALVELCGGRS